MTTAYVNRIATAVPPHDVHESFCNFAQSLFGENNRHAVLFRRMAERAGIEHRYAYVSPTGHVDGGAMNGEAFYKSGAFPDTAARMRAFETLAPPLATAAVEKLDLGSERDRITHILITCCTGMSAPGLDLELIERCGLRGSVERTMIGFMGCAAAINALKLARHIVRSDANARVLALNLELCTLHLQESTDLEQILCFLLFADGCAASLVTSEPQGVALESFHAVQVPNTQNLITWNVRESGFDMMLSGQVPATIQASLPDHVAEILAGAPVDSIDLWAVHPGGRTVLDAVERAFELAPASLSASRDILRRYGNMSSATVMFVLQALMQQAPSGASGCAMAFGPGLVAETMRFRAVG
ncbi:Predicted naringenin-chalcone synthase [Rhizobiales bacterium GAS191]|nr:Predicted naringenin-chalcone synthase [Rhizobiales bacterium GAS188]SEE55040.1 Predicted naringenin-chalcone synthase [Rhizobiales bacterium GAS191]